MDTKELIEILTERHEKSAVNILAKRLFETQSDLSPIIVQNLNKDNKIAFRTAWLLDQINDSYPSYFVEYGLAHFLKSFEKAPNESLKRHYTRIMHSLLKRELLNSSPLEDLNRIGNTCFHWLLDENTKVATQVHCLEVLYYLRYISDFICEELPLQIDSFMRSNPSPAMQAKCRHLLKKLDKAKR